MRKSLLSCALLLVFSVVMLFGTTYAWFSDDFVVEKNSVQLGKLEMNVEYGDPIIKDDNGDQIWYEFTPARHLFEVTKDNYQVTVQPGSVITRVVKVENKGNINMAIRAGFTNLGDEFDINYSLTYNNRELLGEDLYVSVPVGGYVVLKATITVSKDLDNDMENITNFFDFFVHAEQLTRYPGKVIY